MIVGISRVILEVIPQEQYIPTSSRLVLSRLIRHDDGRPIFWREALDTWTFSLPPDVSPFGYHLILFLDISHQLIARSLSAPLSTLDDPQIDVFEK